ncbi:MAG: DUF1343 domain-containing protein [Planctomycetales bacterium]|nr:DUF1343 domain-containing protein [Planctomycetales bacterium]
MSRVRNAFRPNNGYLWALCFLVIGLSHVHIASAAPPALPTASPDAVGMDAQQFGYIAPAVEQAIQEGHLPGCVVLVARRGHIVFHEAFGHRQIEPTPVAMTTDTVFDLASLTKPVSTATSVMLLVEQGKIRLNETVRTYLPEMDVAGKGEITVLQLLTHQAGLIPDSALSEYEDRANIWPHLWKLPLSYPPGERFVYSDVGFQFLGKLVETQSDMTLDDFTEQHIFQPLGMIETGFNPSVHLRDRAAPTEKRNGDWMRGQVHDPRAYAMGGVAGHAGLFSTSSDLATYAQMLLEEGSFNGVRVLGPQTVRLMTKSIDVAGNQRALGWDVRSGYSSNRGELMSARAFGHGGFTGTAMWIDPELQLTVIFLSNRLHPDGVGRVNRLAGRIGSIAAGAIRVVRNSDNSPAMQTRTISESSEARSPVLAGIDVLQADEFRRLANNRVGLITNHTGVNLQGDRTIDLLQAAQNVNLVAIYSPEHGATGTRDDAQIGDDVDAATGVPILSLYGENRSPTAESLATIDVLVFDIQDIGTRFYTYVSTMGLAMRAAAEHGKAFVVLDRPNPLGGLDVAGPVLDAGRESFVGYHKLPVQHGLTIGELAMMIRDQQQIDVPLQVVPMVGWKRQWSWDHTGRTWVNPSPNMRSLTEAYLYPGIGLLEYTNLSVGRGTDRPFEIVGAPWIDERTFASAMQGQQLPGVQFVPRRFTPTASKHADESCGGVDILIVNRSAFQPVRTGLTMASVLRKLYPEQWEFKELDRLLLDTRVLQAIELGKTYPQIEREFADELEVFKQDRTKYLLYP